MSCRQLSTVRQSTLSVAEAVPYADPPLSSDRDADVERAFDLAWRGELEAGPLRGTTFQRGDVAGGRYVIQRFLARGGMGEIYAAFDRALGLEVALKTLLPVVADDPLAIRRLRRELRLGRRIDHPNVCRAFDIAVHDDDPRDVVHFFTMELLRGDSLAARMRREPLSIEEALHIAEQLLLGLQAVHEAGVLHRDVKSHNVVIDERGPTLRAVLADFGLARRLDARQRAPGGPSSGSLGYMAPEQISGGELSPATDLFAVGVILFEMCLGCLPFDRPGQQLFCSGLDVVSRESVASRLPERLREVLARCLSHSPGARYPSARAALAALRETGKRAERA